MSTQYLPQAGLQAQQATVYVVDSNTSLLAYMRESLGDSTTLRLFSEVDSAISALRLETPDLILLAWDGLNESLSGFSKVHAAANKAPVVLLSCSANVEELTQAIQLGAQGFLLKPFDGRDLEETIHRYASRKLPPAGIAEVSSTTDLGDGRSFIHLSKRMRELESQATRVARSDIPVLILGESGTGKDVLALFIHNSSPRRDKTFLKINCAAMPAELLESELFGHEQGAFTGAHRAKPGRFETCDGGTIFLDEIGEMPVSLQAKLLHVLQDGTFSRLGSRNVLKADVRVIAATNVNIREAIANKVFREDLYYRLNGFSMTMPPLRDRKEEIPLFVSYFMRRSVQKYDRPMLDISPALLNLMMLHSWPGNLRELENFVNRYLILGEEENLVAELSEIIGRQEPEDPAPHVSFTGGLKQMARGVKNEAEAVVIARALQETGWNRKAAARNLEISYKALLYKIKNFRLAPPNRG